MRSSVPLLVNLALLWPGTLSVSAATLDFPAGFTGSATSLNYNGSAAISGTRARITDGGTGQSGTVWSKDQVDARAFTTQFTFQITAGTDTADGMTFTVQRAGNTSVGLAGSGMGSMTIDTSVSIKFDVHPDQSTTGLYLNGAHPNDDAPPAIDMAGSGIDLHSGHLFSVTLLYDGAVLHQTVTDMTTSASFTHDYPIDIPAIIGGGDAHVGFTGATGGLTCTQDIIDWTYSILPPEAVDDSVTMHYDTKARIRVVENDLGAFVPGSVEIIAGPAAGTATVSPDGTVLYAHATGTPAGDSFTYRIANPTGTLTDTAVVTINFTSESRIGTDYIDMPPVAPPTPLGVVDAFPGLTFESPHDFCTVAGDSGKLFVAEGNGHIYLIPDVAAFTPTKMLVLSIPAQVETGYEHSMKGIATHPDWASNGYLYVTYDTITGPADLNNRFFRFRLEER